jgi:hypothetical protein
MSEARDIEALVAEFEDDTKNGDYGDDEWYPFTIAELRSLVADWRAKKAEIDSAYAKCEAIAEYEAAQGWSSARRIADAIADLRQRHAGGVTATDAG